MNFVFLPLLNRHSTSKVLKFELEVLGYLGTNVILISSLCSLQQYQDRISNSFKYSCNTKKIIHWSKNLLYPSLDYFHDGRCTYLVFSPGLDGRFIRMSILQSTSELIYHNIKRDSPLFPTSFQFGNQLSHSCWTVNQQ